MKVNFITLLILFTLALCYAQESKTATASRQEKQCSEEIKMLLDKLTITECGLPGLSVLDKEIADEIKNAAYEWWEVPSLHLNCYDCFSCSIIYDNTNETFWVNRRGGVAGVDETYGPIYFDQSDNVIKNKPDKKN
ncbi:MAG: hypothetical protein KBA46_01905 [Candidatus Omnitrophica bacterium]|nr:hypothetical protein [Candidatus Omnitrophota bacterium]